MPKEKYDPPDPRRMYTIMSSEEAANGKKSYWAELEIVGNVDPLWDPEHVRVNSKQNALSLCKVGMKWKFPLFSKCML